MKGFINTDKVFRVEFYLKPRRANRNIKYMESMIRNVTKGMERQYADELKQISTPQIHEYPARNFIIRSKYIHRVPENEKMELAEKVKGLEHTIEREKGISK